MYLFIFSLLVISETIRIRFVFSGFMIKLLKCCLPSFYKTKEVFLSQIMIYIHFMYNVSINDIHSRTKKRIYFFVK
jgi:hypothetical protein